MVVKPLEEGTLHYTYPRRVSPELQSNPIQSNPMPSLFFLEIFFLWCAIQFGCVVVKRKSFLTTMNQSAYLSQTLWDYRDSCDFTDLTLACKDGSLQAHSAMLAGFIASFGISITSTMDVPEFLFLPELTISEVQKSLEAIYFPIGTQNIQRPEEKTPASIENVESDCADDIEDNFDSVQFSAIAVDESEELEIQVVNFVVSSDKKASEHPQKLDNLNKRDKKQHACLLCNKVFKFKSLLTYHTKIRYCIKNSLQNKRENICHVCKKVIKGKRKLFNHIQRHDGIKPIYNFKCGHCRLGFQAEESLKKHTLEDHSGVEYKCSNCPLKFKNKEGKRCHEKRQHAVKIIPCEKCSQMFSAKQYRNAHIKKVHEKVSNKLCTVCGEGFSHIPTYEAHINRHTNYRPFTCEVCLKGFLIKSHLRTHFQLHTLPYKCERCFKCFNSRSHLKDHTRKDHYGLKSECRFHCGWQAAHRSSVTRHETKYCKLNPVPNAPFTIAIGTANKLTLQRFHVKR